MSRIIQVYDEEKQINTEVRCIDQSTDVLSFSTEALTNVLSLWQKKKKKKTQHFLTDTLHVFVNIDDTKKTFYIWLAAWSRRKKLLGPIFSLFEQ